MSRQARLVDDIADGQDFAEGKRAAARFYLRCIIPEALGLRAAALAGAELLYDPSNEALLA